MVAGMAIGALLTLASGLVYSSYQLAPRVPRLGEQIGGVTATEEWNGSLRFALSHAGLTALAALGACHARRRGYAGAADENDSAVRGCTTLTFPESSRRRLRRSGALLPRQQSIPERPIAVVLLRAPTNKLEDLRPLLPQLLTILHGLKPRSVTIVQ